MGRNAIVILYSVVWIRGDNVSVYTGVLGVSYEELSLPGPYLLRSVLSRLSHRVKVAYGPLD